jgi:hypothetical protein
VYSVQFRADCSKLQHLVEGFIQPGRFDIVEEICLFHCRVLLGRVPSEFDLVGQEFLEPISKMSFGPISLLVLRFKSSTYNSMPPV